MLFGRTQEEQRAFEQRECRRRADGVFAFAWLPQRLHDGRWVWLAPYWRHYWVRLVHTDTLRPVYGSEDDWRYDAYLTRQPDYLNEVLRDER